MATTADIKRGLCIEFSNDVYKIVEFQHVKPGKGPAFVRTKLKSVTSGKVVDNTFSAGHKIDVVPVTTNKFQFLYEDENGLHFMHTEDFTQEYLSKDLVDNADLLKEGEEVLILAKMDDGTPLSVEMPLTVTLEVIESPEGVRGNTATNATKPAKVETGAELQVPLFINEGDKIKINVEERAYIERVTK